MTADFWRGLTWRQTGWMLLQGVVGFFGLALAIGGAVVALIDGGASLLMTFSLAQTLAAKIAGEVAITVAVAGVAGAAFAVFMEGLVERNTLPALANFFNLACDAFAAPRRIDTIQPIVRFGNQLDRMFPLPNTQTPGIEPVCPLGLTLWDVVPS